MPTDLTHLSQSELLKLVNCTELGTVLTRSRLGRQMDAAGLRLGDGKTIHLLKYIQWLVAEAERPPAEPAGYDEAKRRQAQRNRAATKASQDIAPIPDVADPARRKRAGKSLRVFAETYFPQIFWRPWSADHRRVIKRLEAAIRHGDLFACAMPRGSGKTSLATVAALWAILYGHRPFVSLIGGSKTKAKELLAPIKLAVLENKLLLADFPDAIFALRALDNSSKRQLQQHCHGQLTHVRWEPDRIVYPVLPAEDLPAALKAQGLEASPAAGSIIAVTSLDSHIRGQQHARADGTIIRPSLVILDDPQTRASARSPGQTKFRLQLLFGDVLGMAGPGESISAAITCSKIYTDDLADQILDREKHPEWQGECTKLIYAFPTNEKLWRQYAEIRADGLRANKRLAPATAFYRKHRKAMDAGAKVAWADRYDREEELSAVQHAMNLQYRDLETFWSEYQNEPMREQVSDDVLIPQAVSEKFNGRPRRTVPVKCNRLTGFVDVHDRLLYWVVCAWEDDFTGYVIDYATFPAQERPWFAMRTARRTLARAFPTLGKDAAILAGLEQLVGELLGREWERAGAGVLRIERLMVDMGYKSSLVAAAKHKVGGEAMMLYRGAPIGARNRPISQYKRKPGERYGHHWYIPSVKGTHEFPHLAADVNYWKSFIHRAFATPAGEPGSLSLFGKTAKAHELLAEHIADSEAWTETQGHGRTVHEWKLRPAAPDNHWFDGLVGCAVAASMGGVQTAGMQAQQVRRRKRYTSADLTRARRQG